MVVRGRTRNAIGPRGRVGSTPTISGEWRYDESCTAFFVAKKFLRIKKVPVHFHVPAKRGREKKNLYKKLTCLLGEGRQPQS